MKLFSKIILSIFFIFFLSNLVFSQKNQSKLDSLGILIEKTSDLEEKEKHLLAKAKILLDNDKIDDAELILNPIIDSKNTENKAIATMYLGIINKEQNKFDEALSLLFEAKSFEEEIETEKIASNIYFEIGYVYMRIGSLQKSIDFLKKSNEKLDDEGNEVEKAKTVNNIAYLYELSGNYDMALKNYRLALEVFEKFDDKKATSYALNNIGALYREIDNYEMAHEYYRKSLEIKKQIGDTASWATTYNNFGVLYVQQQKYDLALEAYEKALMIAQKYDDIKNIGRTTNNMGQLYNQTGEYDKAISLYFKSLELKDSINDNHGKILSYLNIGKIYGIENNENEAINYFRKGILLADSLGFTKELSILYQELSSVYEQANKFSQALEYYKKYSAINDTLLNRDKQKNIDELEIVYRTNEKEKQLEMLKSENENKEKILIRNSIIATILVLMLVISGLFILMMNNRKKLKAENKTVVLEQKLLRTQMNPHFIFNSLSAIQSYVYNKKTLEAGKYISDFAKLMRLILENSRKEFIPLQKEVETLKYYLKLQQIRFDHKFDYTINVDSTINQNTAEIPPMLAQPIIENAIEHGIKKIDYPGFIEIHFDKDNNNIKLTVNNTGTQQTTENSQPQKEKHKSYALTIIKERLTCYNIKNKIVINSNTNDNNQYITTVSFLIPIKNAQSNNN